MYGILRGWLRQPDARTSAATTAMKKQTGRPDEARGVLCTPFGGLPACAWLRKRPPYPRRSSGTAAAGQQGGSPRRSLRTVARPHTLGRRILLTSPASPRAPASLTGVLTQTSKRRIISAPTRRLIDSAAPVPGRPLAVHRWGKHPVPQIHHGLNGPLPSVSACQTDDVPDFRHQRSAMWIPPCTADLIWYDMAEHAEFTTVNKRWLVSKDLASSHLGSRPLILALSRAVKKKADAKRGKCHPRYT